MLIRIAEQKDLQELLDIYNYEAVNSVANLDLNPRTLAEWQTWFDHHNVENHPLYVAEEDGRVAGYSSLSSYREKEAYKSTVELSIYISPDYRKRGIATELRLGYAIVGIVAPEFSFSAHGWDLGSKAGGTGFIGGGLRLYPIGLIDKLGLDVKDFPIDVSVAGNMGYNLVGKDFAYTGLFFGLDLTVEYIVAEVFSTGFRVGWALPSYSAFAYTDYNNSLGRCLDTSGSQDPNQVPFKKGTQSCSGGSGPSTSYLDIQITATFHFQLFN